MIVVSCVILIAIFLTYLETRGRLKNGMFIGFILVTFLGCVHYNYGSDYGSYYNIFEDINKYPFSFEILFDNTFTQETGWVAINYLFGNFGGFFLMVAVLNIIQNYIYFDFIKSNVDKRYWTISVIIYLLSTSLYILNFSMMRQGFAIALFVFSWKFIKERRVLLSLIILVIASLFHASAQLIIPFVLLPFIPLGKKMISLLYAVMIAALFFSKDLLGNIFYTIIGYEELDSTNSLDHYMSTSENVLTFGLGFIINMIPFVVAIWSLLCKGDQIDKQKTMLVSISFVSFIIVPFGQLLPIVNRFGMYFEAYSIAAIPFIYSLLPKKMYQVLICVFIMMHIYSYYMFFQNPSFIKPYATFHTIFEVL